MVIPIFFVFFLQHNQTSPVFSIRVGFNMSRHPIHIFLFHIPPF
jgi:hypothetical protein